MRPTWSVNMRPPLVPLTGYIGGFSMAGTTGDCRVAFSRTPPARVRTQPKAILSRRATQSGMRDDD